MVTRVDVLGKAEKQETWVCVSSAGHECFPNHGDKE